MSRARAEKILHLEPADRVGLAYAIEHPAFLADYTGIDPRSALSDATLAAIKKMDADVAGGVPSRMEAPFEASGTVRCDAAGHRATQWGYGSTPWYEGRLGDFADEDSLFEYNPLQEDLLPWKSEYVRQFRETDALLGHLAYPLGAAGYYFSLVTHCTAVFGWERFLLAAAAEPARFRSVLELVGEHTLAELEAMVAAGSAVYTVHDDIAATRGLILSPEWLRTNALPWYEKFFDVIKRAGSKVWFISDGNYAAILDDLVAVGADGFYADHSMDLEWLVSRLRGERFLVATLDQRVLSRGDREAVQRQTRQHLRAAKRHPGHFLSATVPHDVPVENVYAFLREWDKSSPL